MRSTAIILLVCLASAVFAAESSRMECDSSTGCQVIRDFTSSPPFAPPHLGEVFVSGSGSILWKAYQAIDIYDTVGITDKGAVALSSYGSNYALHDTLEVSDSATGKRKWLTTNGTDFDVSVDKLGASSIFPVMDRIPCCPVPTITMFSNALEFSVDSATPRRNATLYKTVVTAGFSGVAQSTDATVFAYGFDYIPHFPTTDAYYGRVVVVQNGTVATTLTFANATTIDDVELSYDGRYLTIFVVTGQGEEVYVYDRQHSDFVLNSTRTDFISGIGLCVSPNGGYVAVGFQTIDVWMRSPTTGVYSQIISGAALPVANTFFSTCAISDNGYFGMALFTQDYLQTYAAMVTVGHGAQMKTVWTWASAQENGTDQDYPVSAAMDPDTKLFTFCSWGTGVGMTPTARVFSVAKAQEQLIFNITTPGSMFDIDIAASPQSKDSYLVITAGKHVHANVMGDGGDLVMALVKYP